MQDRAAPGTAFGLYTQLACFARPRRLHQTTLPIAERVSSRKPSGTSSSAHATSAEPAAANKLVPAVNIAAPPSSGTAQHAAQAAPAPATAFQGFISVSRNARTSPAVGKPKCSSDLRIKRITEPLAAIRVGIPLGRRTSCRCLRMDRPATRGCRRTRARRSGGSAGCRSMPIESVPAPRTSDLR